jgi:hypothetical protein
MAVRSLDLVRRCVVRELGDDRCIAADDDTDDSNELRGNVAAGGVLRTCSDFTRAADSELSGNALAVAAKRGRLRAVRRTDQWYSTRQWVQEYKQHRYRRA